MSLCDVGQLFDLNFTENTPNSNFINLKWFFEKYDV